MCVVFVESDQFKDDRTAKLDLWTVLSPCATRRMVHSQSKASVT